MTALPGEGWDDAAIDACTPTHLDMARMRRFVAAIATSDGPAIGDVMTEAGLEGAAFKILVAAAHQLATEHRLYEPDNLVEWRQGILFHLNQHEGSGESES